MKRWFLFWVLVVFWGVFLAGITNAAIDNVIISSITIVPDTPQVGDTVDINVSGNVQQSGLWPPLPWAVVNVSTGDGGSVSHSDFIQADRRFNFLLQYTSGYSSEGTYTIEIEVCIDEGGPAVCETVSTSITVVSAPLACVPDGCNADCPANCSVAEDPDCGCLNGDGCCGIDCDNASDDDCPAVPTVPSQYDNPLLWEDIPEFVERAVIFFFTVALYGAPLLIIIGAYVLVTSGGLPSRIDLGKKIIIWTLIGLAIMLIARGLIALVHLIFGG